jgi:hypothetical protein
VYKKVLLMGVYDTTSAISAKYFEVIAVRFGRGTAITSFL